MNTAYIYRITIVQIDNNQSLLSVDKFGLKSDHIYTKLFNIIISTGIILRLIKTLLVHIPTNGSTH